MFIEIQTLCVLKEKFLFKEYLLLIVLFVARLNIQYPMLFKLTNKRVSRQSHCGVLEFVADEGRIYIPHWVSYRIKGFIVFEPIIIILG